MGAVSSIARWALDVRDFWATRARSARSRSNARRNSRNNSDEGNERVQVASQPRVRQWTNDATRAAWLARETPVCSPSIEQPKFVWQKAPFRKPLCEDMSVQLGRASCVRASCIQQRQRIARHHRRSWIAIERDWCMSLISKKDFQLTGEDSWLAETQRNYFTNFSLINLHPARIERQTVFMLAKFVSLNLNGEIEI